MKLFECRHCGQQLYFENTRCERCGHALGYDWQDNRLEALKPLKTRGQWAVLSRPGRAYRYCANAARGVCNWLLPAESEQTLCLACGFNRMIPDLGDMANLERWRKLEVAKHRLIYSLLRLGLPLENKRENPENGLAFDFLADTPPNAPPTANIRTGHEQGLITLNIAEADDLERERLRQQMGEPYRTLLGHFRHESGHYYWMRLIRDSDCLADFRHCFGDERPDYAQALATHYRDGPPADWPNHFVSAYAASHPWEDWAETWAHYLHIVDTLETAYYFGLSLNPRTGGDVELAVEVDFDAYGQGNFDRLIRTWLPLTYALNSLNHGMGRPDIYPFVLSPGGLDKLRFIHQIKGYVVP